MTDHQQLELDVRIPGQRTGQRTGRGGPADSVAVAVRPTSPASPAPADPWQSLPWRTVARVSVSRSLVTWLVTMLVLAVMPLAVGWTPRVIMSGSMEPAIHTGDVVVTRPVDGSEIGAGTVITTLDPDKPGKTRTHRMVERDAEGMVVTRGDANPDRDSTPVADADVLGAGVLRVPFVGLPAYWLRTGELGALALALVVLTGAVVGSFRPRAPRPGGDPSRGGGTAGPGGPRPTEDRPERRVRARGRRARRAGAAVTLTMAAALVVTAAPGSYAAFAARTSTPAASFAAGTQFYPYRDAVLADRPSLYWRLDETAGTVVADSSGRGATGTARGSLTWGQPGALGSEPGSTSASLTGGFVSADAAASGSGRFSFEAWVRTTSSQGGPLVTFGNGSGNQASTSLDRVLYVGSDGRARFGVQSSGLLGLVSSRDTVTSAAPVNDGSWHHVVGTYAPVTGGIRLYVDGQLQPTATADYTVQSRNGWFYRAGGESLSAWPSAPAATTLAGRVDEVAVYDGTALDAARVQAHLAASRP